MAVGTSTSLVERCRFTQMNYSGLLKQALFPFTDMVVMLVMERKGVSVKAMQKSHTNLEGLPHSFA